VRNFYHPLRGQQKYHQTHIANGEKEKIENSTRCEILPGIVEMNEKENGNEADIDNIQESSVAHLAMTKLVVRSKNCIT
jgi:hypothetical protein